MSITGFLKQVTPEQLAEIIEDPDLIEDLMDDCIDEDIEDALYLDKAWNGIHFLLNEDASGGEEPLRFAVMGREEIGEDDGGYGPPLYIPVDDVKAIAKILSELPAKEVASKFNPHKMDEAGVYPAIWEDEYALDFLMDHYTLLVEYYRDAANKGNAMLVFWV
jgi:hypothetical protein